MLRFLPVFPLVCLGCLLPALGCSENESELVNQSSAEETIPVESAENSTPEVNNADQQPFTWPQWRGPEQNGKTRESISPEAINPMTPVLWRRDIGIGYSGVSVREG